MSIGDRRAHFLTLIGDVCTAAGLGEIEVEFELADGSTARGVPTSQADQGTDELDQTGYANRMLIDGSPIALDSVVAFCIRTPDRRDALSVG